MVLSSCAHSDLSTAVIYPSAVALLRAVVLKMAVSASRDFSGNLLDVPFQGPTGGYRIRDSGGWSVQELVS